MARYIDTSKVTIPKGFFEDLNVPKLLDWLNSQPTADVVEVVRCKDCKHCEFDKWDDDILCGCLHPSGLNDVSPNAYCSYGERRETNAE